LTGTLRHGRAGGALLALGVTALALMTGYAAQSDALLKLEVAAIGLMLLLLLPVEMSLIAAVLLANGAGGYAAGLADAKGTAAGVAVAVLAAARVLATSNLPPRQLRAGLGALVFLGISSVNAVTLQGLHGLTSASSTVLPYAMLVLLLAWVPAGRVAELLRSLAIAAGILAALYVATALTGHAYVPGVYRTDPQPLLGTQVYRVYAPGGLLYVFGVLWAVVELAARPRSRALPVAILAACAGAVLASQSRTVYLAGGAAIVVCLLLMSSSHERRRLRLGAIVIASVLAVGGVALNPRLTKGVTEVRQTSGNFGARVKTVKKRQNLIREHPFLGVGLASSSEQSKDDSVDLSDSATFTIVARFGVLGVLGMIALYVATIRTIRGLRRRGSAHLPVAALGGGLLLAYALLSLTTDALVTSGGLGLFCLVIGLVLGLHPRDRDFPDRRVAFTMGGPRTPRAEPTTATRTEIPHA
jgi:O-antigen ligase